MAQSVRPNGAVTPKISIRGLRKAFNGKTVLAGVDLDVAAGDNLVLLGVSGSGKTVLMKCILGLIQPDAGSIRIDGEETVGLPADQRDRLLRRFGVLFQNGALFDSLPVWHNIAFSPMSREGLAREAAKDLARAKLAAVNLPPATADLYPAELSGGMQKRVALARAIAGRPDILLLDDPTAGLDPILTTLIDQLILRSLDDLKATAITITHDLASVRRIADRVALLADGRIVWEGGVGELERAGHPAVARFIRGSRAA